MDVLLFILGLVLILLALGDALWTALWVDGGAGPVTSLLSDGIWGVMDKVIRTKRNYLLSLAGPLIQVVAVITWVILLWAGWVLMFSADENSLIYTRTPEKVPADLVGRIYFVAFSMSTMGNGDFYPKGKGWEIATSFTTLSGMFLITMVVSFLLSVIGGVTQKRSLASHVTGLGKSAEQFILNTWDGESFTGIDLQLISLSSELGTLTEQQQAYPVLHRYHGASPKEDSAPAIAIFDDALTILQYGIEEKYRPAPAILISARSTVQTYLTTLASASIYPAKHLPPSPDLEPLRKAGLPVVSDEEFIHSLKDLTHRRKLLLGLVQKNSFRWPNYTG
ncbi:Ion transport 2 domain protein [Gloeothece citriformis PCC 7424]|uniref:Ion transport 2 domain protein n=1 Tax=Gloeothece citriformis (strain PCC 7424) TaxID=65393 RepID=B7K7J1_GLOC7|nr:potassium channel family protein [Gloeothece citriformis]ACK69759.1 Ion transport 2 domain protein [Gloeothece citriformis PCC 7424]